MKIKSLYIISTAFILVMAIMTTFSSCGENEEEKRPYIRTENAETTIEAQGLGWAGWSTTLQTNIDISELKVLCREDWCSAELKVSRSGQCTLIVKADDNTTRRSRKATITVKHIHSIASIDFTLKQEVGASYIQFKEDNLTVSAEAQELELEFETNTIVNFHASSSKAWCKPTVLSQSVKVIIDKNESLSERHAVVTIKSINDEATCSLTIQQQTGAPVIEFRNNREGERQNTDASSKTWKWTLYSNLPYNDLEVNSSENWCNVELSDCEDVAGMKPYQLTINIEENQLNENRSTVVTISSKSKGISTAFSINQDKPTMMSLSHIQFAFDRDGGSRTVSVSSNVSWKAECDADWITLEQNGNELTIHTSSTTTDRTTQITFKNRESLAITITQTKYKVGDAYSEDGVTGTVGYISDDKRFIFQKVGDELQYREHDSAGKDGTGNIDDGQANTTAVIKLIINNGKSFPAFQAATRLNTNGVSGWYLPAINELEAMKAFIQEPVWSSTESYVLVAYYHDGTEIKQKNKGNKLAVYAIKQF